jgi:TolA-binding protein
MKTTIITLFFLVSLCLSVFVAMAQPKSSDQIIQNLKAEIKFDSHTENSYRALAGALQGRWMYAEAMEVYLQGRRTLKDDFLFAQELAASYQQQMRFEEAVEEYYKYLVKNPTNYDWVESSMVSILQNKDLQKYVLEKGEKYHRDHSKNIGIMHFLANLYLKEGRDELAIAYAEKIDRQDGTNRGAELERLAARFERGQKYEKAAEVYGRVTSAERRSRLKEAEMLILARQYKEAEQKLLKYIEEYGKDQNLYEAQRMLGQLYYKHLRDYAAAEHVLSAAAVPALKLEMGHLYFARRDFAAAAGYYTEVVQSQQSIDFKDKAIFALAESYYYEQDFESALENYQKLAQDFPKSHLINDAAGRQMLIQNGRDFDGIPLKLYASAEVLVLDSRYDEALKLFSGIISTYPKSQMVSYAQLKIAEIYAQKGEAGRAVIEYQNLSRLSPDSAFNPEAQMRIGEIYAETLSDRDKALKYYEQVLQKYASSPMVEEARRKIEELRGTK